MDRPHRRPRGPSHQPTACSPPRTLVISNSPRGRGVRAPRGLGPHGQARPHGASGWAHQRLSLDDVAPNVAVRIGAEGSLRRPRSRSSATTTSRSRSLWSRPRFLNELRSPTPTLKRPAIGRSGRARNLPQTVTKPKSEPAVAIRQSDWPKSLIKQMFSERGPGPSKLWIWGSPVRAGAVVPSLPIVRDDAGPLSINGLLDHPGWSSLSITDDPSASIWRSCDRFRDRRCVTRSSSSCRSSVRRCA